MFLISLNKKVRRKFIRGIGTLVFIMTCVFLVTGLSPEVQRQKAIESVGSALPDSAAIPLGIRPAKVSMVNPFKSRIFFSLNTVRNIAFWALDFTVFRFFLKYLYEYSQTFQWGREHINIKQPQLPDFGSDTTLYDLFYSVYAVIVAALWNRPFLSSALAMSLICLVRTWWAPNVVLFNGSKEALDFWSYRPKFPVT